MTASDASHEAAATSGTGPVSADCTRAESEGCRVGVLSPHNSKETKAILNAVRAMGHEPVWLRDENVASWIEDGCVERSPGVDVLVNRLLLTKSDRRLEDLQLAALYADTVPVVNTPQAVADTLHKFRAGTKLAAAGLPVPDAYFGRSPRTFEAWSDHLPRFAAHKQTIGTNGQRMAIVSSDHPVGPTIDDHHSFVQEFLETGDDRPSDVRVYVVADEIVGAMRRYAPEGDWRTNVALGGDVEDVTDELGPRPRRIAREAARVLGLDLAGVDLMSVDGTWYVLEVNATAGFKGLFSATGVSAAPHIARLAVERVGGTVEDSRVGDLESTLDDSVPDCKPPLVEDSGTDRVLGYTTRVRVAGRDGTERTVAKSDTGAKRTSSRDRDASPRRRGPAARRGLADRHGQHRRPLRDDEPRPPRA
jgi:RimK family alpha-L-glutamate ligase